MTKSGQILHRPKTIKHDKSFSFYSPKLSPFIIAICVTLLVLLQIQSLHSPINTDSPSPSSSWSLLQQWQKLVFDKNIVAAVASSSPNCTHELDLESMTQKLRDSVTFLPLKDLRYAHKPLDGHTWFMSSMYDTREEEGEVQHQQFPSESSKGRILCLKGRDTHDGSWNYYALAYPEALPSNAIIMKGLTFVAYNHYNYDNIWHGLSAMFPFVAWHKKNGCEIPTRWILYHWGELRYRMGNWLNTMMEATFGHVPNIQVFDEIKDDDDDNRTVCFEKAVVMRHNEGGMSRERRMEVYDLIRCKARLYCNLSLENRGADIGMTLLMRTGPRSFRNETTVIGVFEKECKKVEGCRLMVAYSNNLSFCEQVISVFAFDLVVWELIAHLRECRIKI